MIKVLVVDDDKLVRKGLISAIPWQDYGMKVEGEANNGERALEYLEAHPVDLLLTDLAMPVMSGIELMRVVRKRFPHMFIVVLTFHQDFEYIQEALRLGAIDYIAKVQLEKERFEEILERIYGRIMQERQKLGTGSPLQEPEILASDWGYALLPLHSEPIDDRARLWLERSAEFVLELGSGLWLWIGPESSTVEPEEPMESIQSIESRERLGSTGSLMLEQMAQESISLADWAIIKLGGLSGRSVKDVHRRLAEYREKALFYEYDPKDAIGSLLIEEWAEQASLQPEEDFSVHKERWSSCEWIHNDPLFDQLIHELQLFRLPQARLIGFLYSQVDEWNRVFQPVSKEKIELTASFHFWYQVVEWLRRIRGSIRQTIDRASFSKEVINCMLKAVAMVHEALDQPVTAIEISRKVNMSRSYFSQCFKDIVGTTFNDYVRQARIEKAREYLLHTNKPILWIAEHTGYMDEKYFSRIFREQTGMLPSEYRQMSRTGR